MADKRIIELPSGTPTDNDSFAFDGSQGTKRSTLETLKEEIAGEKQDKEPGKGLSTNDFSDAEKTKLAGLENYDDTEIKADIEALDGRLDTAESDIDSLETNKVGFADYATSSKGGTVKVASTNGVSISGSGLLRGVTRTLTQYGSDADTLILDKGTLENIKTDLVDRAGAVMKDAGSFKMGVDSEGIYYEVV